MNLVIISKKVKGSGNQTAHIGYANLLARCLHKLCYWFKLTTLFSEYVLFLLLQLSRFYYNLSQQRPFNGKKYIKEENTSII